MIHDRECTTSKVTLIAAAKNASHKKVEKAYPGPSFHEDLQ